MPASILLLQAAAPATAAASPAVNTSFGTPDPVAIGFFAVFICITLGIYAVWFVQSTYQLGERALAIPIKIWPIQLVLPWMFFSSALRHLAFAIWPALKPAPPLKPLPSAPLNLKTPCAPPAVRLLWLRSAPAPLPAAAAATTRCST